MNHATQVLSWISSATVNKITTFRGRTVGRGKYLVHLVQRGIEYDFKRQNKRPT